MICQKVSVILLEKGNRFSIVPTTLFFFIPKHFSRKEISQKKKYKKHCFHISYNGTIPPAPRKKP